MTLASWSTSASCRRSPAGRRISPTRAVGSADDSMCANRAGQTSQTRSRGAQRNCELPCVGWLVNQIGPGNNIGLRLAVLSGQVDADVRTIGPQHSTFEETMPREQ